MSRRVLVVAVALKVVLVALVLFALIHLEWDRFADKAMTARAVIYPLAALVVPVVWLAARRRFAYPAVVDALLVTPFVVDLAGNALDLYDRISSFRRRAAHVPWVTDRQADGEREDESVTAYRDTVGDLTLGLTGSVVAGVVAATRRYGQS